MTVQTTFVGGVNPWAQYFKEEKPKRGRGSKLTIDVDQLVMKNEVGDRVGFDSLENYKDIFVKIKDGYSITCGAGDIAKVLDSFQRYRKINAVNLRMDISRGQRMIKFSTRTNKEYGYAKA